MPWVTGDKLQCPCAQCASFLPTPTLLCTNTQRTHKKRYGLAVNEEASACVEDESKDLQGPDVFPAAPVLESPPVGWKRDARDPTRYARCSLKSFNTPGSIIRSPL
jgi:hypothetical protein